MFKEETPGACARHESTGKEHVAHFQRDWPVGGLERWQELYPAGPRAVGWILDFKYQIWAGRVGISVKGRHMQA